MGAGCSKKAGANHHEDRTLVSVAVNPLTTDTYAVPVMTSEEMSKIVVPFTRIDVSLREVLDTYGLAIVTNVISSDEVSAFEQYFMRDLTGIIDEDRIASAPKLIQDAYVDFQTKGPRALPLATASALTVGAGFALDRCLPHGEFAWAARTHPHVHKTYQAIYPEAAGFVTSLDVPFFTPEKQQSVASAKFSAHVDQNKHDSRPGLADAEVFQGVLYIWSSESDHASTTTAWPGSHTTVWEDLMQDADFKEAGSAGFHYSEVRGMRDKTQARKLAAGWATGARRLPVPSGALLLWNSRTMHTGWKGGPRLAQTVCLEPTHRRPPQEQTSKMRLAALGLPSVHWASIAMQHDMSLGSPGVFNHRSVKARQCGPTCDDVILPLRPAMRPKGLASGQISSELQNLVNVDYKYVGMWEAPESVGPLLEESVADNVKSYL